MLVHLEIRDFRRPFISGLNWFFFGMVASQFTIYGSGSGRRYSAVYSFLNHDCYGPGWAFQTVARCQTK